MDIYSWILALGIASGQLIKLPLINQNGITLLDVAVIILTAIGLIKLKFKLKRPPSFIIASLFFILVAVISLIFTPLHLELPQYAVSFFYTIRFTLLILLGWEIYSGAFPAIKKHIPKIFLFSGLAIATLGIIQFIFMPDLRFLDRNSWDPHYYRLASTFLDPNFAGAFLVLILLSLLASSRKKKSVIFKLIFAIIYFALLATFSRSSYLMFLIGFLSLAFLKKSIKLAIVTILLFALLLFSFQIYIKAVNRVTPLDRDQTARYRLSTWLQGLQIFWENPLLGVGFNTYSLALRKYNLGDEQFLSGRGATSNDSSLLHVLSTTGILGFSAYLFFLITLARLGWKKNPVLTSALLGLLVESSFINSLFYPFILLWIILISVNSYEKSAN